MEKPRSLRKALIAAIPELRNEKERLKVWIENGSMRATQTGNLSFSFEYPLSVLIEECETDISVISFAILRWLGVNQPDLLQANGTSFTFETDVLDNKTADIAITLNLVERVTAKSLDEGGWELEYVPEPDPLFDDATGFVGLDPIPDLTEVRLCDGNE